MTLKIDIYLTFSKILALIVLAVGAYYAFTTKDTQVMIFAMSLSAGLSGLKTWQTAAIQKAQITAPTCPTPTPDPRIPAAPVKKEEDLST